MKIQAVNILFFFLFFFTCFTGCVSDNTSEKQGKLQEQIQECESLLNVDPVVMKLKIDSLLPSVKDSFVYYHLLVSKSSAMMFLSELDSMQVLLEQIEAFCLRKKKSLETDLLLSEVNNSKGNYYVRLSAVDTASVFFEKAYDYAQKAGRLSYLPDIAINLADSFVRRGRLDLAAFWFWKSLSLYNKLDFPEEKRFPAYFGLAQIHMELQDYTECDSLYDRVGKYFDKMCPSEQHAYLNNRGNSYYFRGDYKTALHYFRLTQKLVNERPALEFERNLTDVNLGEVFLLLNQTDSAAFYLSRCYDYFKKIENTSALYYIDTQLIELALRQRNLPLARKRVENAVNPDYVEPNMVHVRNKYLQHYFEETGNFKDAYYYQKDNARFEDSICNERAIMKTSEIALRYRQDSLLMNNEILIRQQENKVLRLRLWIFILGIGALALGALVWGFFLYRRRKNDQKLWQMQMTINSQRLNNIRNRISPHFIFNVLNHEIIRCKDESEKSNMYALVNLIRRNLELTDKIGIPLSEELGFVNDYLSLERQALGDDFKFILDVDDAIDLNQIIVPSMFLHLLVENAVKHSLVMKDGRRRLWLRVYQEDDRILIKLSDNGGGFKKNNPTMGTGTGMKVITQTIQLFNLYNKKPILMKVQDIAVEDSEKGCEISYSIPLNYSYKINI